MNSDFDRVQLAWALEKIRSAPSNIPGSHAIARTVYIDVVSISWRDGFVESFPYDTDPGVYPPNATITFHLANDPLKLGVINIGFDGIADALQEFLDLAAHGPRVDALIRQNILNR